MVQYIQDDMGALSSSYYPATSSMPSTEPVSVIPAQAPSQSYAPATGMTRDPYDAFRETLAAARAAAASVTGGSSTDAPDSSDLVTLAVIAVVAILIFRSN